ncbi:hypothetical protein EG327_011044 [Venturia inaequalis]|uniref:Uncharacterized protein n=1 Tax=Venturia inaequalis TaxID=5025 RepID=A0A8H3ZFX3_VENIN|nr:hypothetical protein EG327_011044 [Venturia inaequalis]
MNQNIPQHSMLAYFRDGTGVLELCTTLKQVATTMITSNIPSATSAPPGAPLATATATATPTPSAQAKPNGTEGEKLTGMLALSKPVLIAVIAGITVALAIIIMIAAMMFRKHYR